MNRHGAGEEMQRRPSTSHQRTPPGCHRPKAATHQKATGTATHTAPPSTVSITPESSRNASKEGDSGAAPSKEAGAVVSDHH